MFVDMVVDVGGGNEQQIRYHVMQDKDKKWYFEPRPDLASLLAMGLNDEAASKDVCWELGKTPANKGEPGAGQPATKPADKVPAKAEPSTPTSKVSPR